MTRIFRPHSWLEDPGRPIPPEVTRLTTIGDADVAGRRIDEDFVERLLLGTGIIIAHNARFDRGFVERRLPVAAGRPWACSWREVDSRDRGLDGSGAGLGWLLAQAGWSHDGHRAAADVDAVMGLLRHRFDDGRSALSVLLETAAEPGWIVRADGAPFALKHRLKARGYRWDERRGVWTAEIRHGDRGTEEAWLRTAVFSGPARATRSGPSFEEVTSSNRHL